MTSRIRKTASGFHSRSFSCLFQLVLIIFLQLGRFQPFVLAGYGVQAIKMNVTSDQDQVRLYGSGPDVGLGFDSFIRDRSSIGLAVTERFVHYRQPDDPRFRGGLDSRSTLINARWNVYF